MTGNPSSASVREQWMTVAKVRVAAGGDGADTKVLFYESARIYRLLRTNPRYDEILRHLRLAEGGQRAIKVRLDRPEGEVIEDAE
jgi:hypothetical protein